MWCAEWLLSMKSGSREQRGLMAYLKELRVRCQYTVYCPRFATVEVFNQVNASQGLFCRTCGRRRLKELQRREGGQ